MSVILTAESKCGNDMESRYDKNLFENALEFIANQDKDRHFFCREDEIIDKLGYDPDRINFYGGVSKKGSCR